MAEFVEVMNQWKRICESFNHCINGCPLYKHSGVPLCSAMANMPAEENHKVAMKFEEVAMNWAKEHPVKTNAMKLEEVFGVEFNDTEPCGLIQCPNGVDCAECQYKDFWQQEYKGDDK